MKEFVKKNFQVIVQGYFAGGEIDPGTFHSTNLTHYQKTTYGRFNGCANLPINNFGPIAPDNPVGNYAGDDLEEPSDEVSKPIESDDLSDEEVNSCGIFH